MDKFKQTTSLLAISVAAAAFATPTFAQESASSVEIEEVVVIGSRSQKPRTATDSPVPVDAFSGSQFNSIGNAVDITDNLKALVPSFTATPATGDGSAFVRPTSMRGMAPDQSLVLIDGKRRHRSALVQFFAPAAGNGAHGPDIGMIPGIALKRVEVLRDGAAAQYGSDAIAGVINFVTKDANEGGQVDVQYGQFYQGEYSFKVSANAGLPLGDTGFFNISAEYTDNEALSRGIQRADAQALIDAGVQGVGADSPFDDAPFAQTWGRPETSGTRLFINSGIDLTDTMQFYLRGNYAQTDGRYRFFYRRGYADPTVFGQAHSSIEALRALGFTGLQQGYTPYLDGAQTDYSVIGGLKGETDGGMIYDLSISQGSNTLDYFLNNTLNPSLGLSGGQPVQRDFDVGGYEQKETNINLDFSKPIGDNINLAFGGEYRNETYTIIAGEENSYIGAGSNGLGGFKPQDAGAFSRDNVAAYVDIEHDVSDAVMLQYAVRYENFSDFGSTVNGKIAGRFNVTEGFTIRGAVSTGFHAPTPGQANVRTTITTFDGITGQQIEEGLIPATSAEAIAAGGRELTEETSLNFSLGFTTDLSDSTTLAVDFYRIDVDDRIYRTGDVRPDDDLSTPDVVEGPTISFYTNAIDTRSQGVDVVLTSAFDWSAETSTDFSFAANYNKFDVRGQKQFTLDNGTVVTPVSDSTVEDIENNYPKFRFVATANTHFGDKFNFMTRANFYGSHFDERGRIGVGAGESAKISAIVYFDMELGYQYNDNLRFVAGASNIFDSFIGEVGPPNANRLSVGLQYPRRSAANYEGGSWYLRASYQF